MMDLILQMEEWKRERELSLFFLSWFLCAHAPLLTHLRG
jgi:hypothetical protein